MTQEKEITDILHQTSIFAGIGKKYLEKIVEICKLRKYSPGDMIFDQGSASSELYIVAEGEIDILIQIEPEALAQNRMTEETTITTIRRLGSFGEISLVDDGIRSAAARCGTADTTLIVIPRKKLIKLCENYPRLGYGLMRNLAIDLALTIRTRTTDMQIREQMTWHRTFLGRY
nr:cyclic nucleotide-binding domain-containing protein [Anaerolineae bacterium]